MAKIVLVSGAWHGAWCWQKLVPLLEASGHSVAAPELIGTGSDRRPPGEITLARWADQVASVVVSQGEPVILLGHSRGGIVISEVAERVPKSIAHLVYLAAFLLPNGETLGGFVHRVSGGSGSSLAEPSADGLTTSVPRQSIGPKLYNATPAELVSVAERNMGAEPVSVFRDKLSLTGGNFGTVPRAYFECLRDNAVPLALQKAMQAALPCRPVVTLDTDHCPFFSAPERLSDAIDDLSAEAKAPV